jgi:hypothetical protein
VESSEENEPAPAAAHAVERVPSRGSLGKAMLWENVSLQSKRGRTEDLRTPLDWKISKVVDSILNCTISDDIGSFVAEVWG